MGHIEVEEAEELILFDAVAIQPESDHRWYTRELVVYDDDGTLKGFYHDRPKTEEQEGMDEFDSNPVETFLVKEEPVTITKYTPV